MRGFVAPLIKLVVFLVITAVATYVLAATISNQAYGDTTSYKADFSDITGLQEGDDVRIAGVRVGSIEGIKILKRDNGTSIAQVSFSVQKSRPLPETAFARLRYRNLVGQRYLDIERGAGNTNKNLGSGDTIPLSHTQNAVDLTVLFAGFQPLVQGLNADTINKLSLEVVKTLQGEAGSLQLLLANLADLTNAIADKDQVIGDLVDNLSSVLTAVGNRDQELTQLIIQLKNFVSGLAKDRKTIGNAIDGINDLATSTAGLLTQVRAPLKSDIVQLNGLVANLNHHSDTTTYLLQQLPPTVAGLIRTAQYGSWFNFYLCGAYGHVTIPGGVRLPIKNLAAGSADNGRCQ